MARNNSLDNPENLQRALGSYLQSSKCQHNNVIYIRDIEALLGRNHSRIFTPEYTSDVGCLECGNIVKVSSSEYRQQGNIYHRVSESERESLCWGV